MVARILSGIVGLFMLWTCLGWLMDPATAAALIFIQKALL